MQTRNIWGLVASTITIDNTCPCIPVSMGSKTCQSFMIVGGRRPFQMETYISRYLDVSQGKVRQESRGLLLAVIWVFSTVPYVAPDGDQNP